MKERCVCYARVSTKKQEEKWSIPAQLRILPEYAEKTGWDIVYDGKNKVFNEGGVSGETITERPKFQKILELARQEKFDIILVIEMERISRSDYAFDWPLIIKTFAEHNIKLATPYRIYNPVNPEEIFDLLLAGGLSTREKMKMMERFQRGKIEAAGHGRWIPGQVPLGYDYIPVTRGKPDSGKLVINEKEAEIIRTIFKLYNKSGYTAKKVAEELNKLGYRGKKGGKFRNGQISYILANSVYAGSGYYNRYKWKNGKRHLRPQEDWVKIKISPIVSEKDFEKIRKLRTTRRLESVRNKKHFYLLAQMLYCECGSRYSACMLIHRSKRTVWKKKYYKCYRKYIEKQKDCRSRLVGAERIESLVWEKIKEIVKNPALIFAKIKDKEKDYDKKTHQKDLAGVLKKLKKVKEEEERILLAYREKVINLKQLKKQLAQLREKEKVLDKRREEVEGQIEASNQSKGKAQNLKIAFSSIKYQIDNYNDQQKRALLKALQTRVTIYYDGTVKIDSEVPKVKIPVNVTKEYPLFDCAWSTLF